MTTQVFRPDRTQYWRDQAWLAAGAMAAGMVLLWALGNPHVWTGAVGGLLAIALRAWIMASEELAHAWHLSADALDGPAGRHVALTDIARLRRLGSAVQIVTRGGDKHLIKYNADATAVLTTLRRASGVQA
jgi:hypothetical protein